MTPIEAAQVIADAGVVEINIDTRGVITGVMRAETFTFEDGPPEPFRSFQPASTLDPRLREACEVYLRETPQLATFWLREASPAMRARTKELRIMYPRGTVEVVPAERSIGVDDPEYWALAPPDCEAPPHDNGRCVIIPKPVETSEES